MVQVGDWVLIHEDAVGSPGSLPDPGNPVKVIRVTDDFEGKQCIWVDTPKWVENFFNPKEYTVVEPLEWEKELNAGTVPDVVNNPSHYMIVDGFEVIDVIKALASDDYFYGNAIKYLLRAKRKDNLVQDLQKCKKHIDWMIENAESQTPSG